ncbi:zinc finger protein 90 homolog [Topomyia yanbarensis]|uniref:zinc finger protein 90 homolog n=1 Tax=Topomyia yanbarensis TaxID=2498891 RepID=UPI00273C80E0|nr:zinc finger protein 90 homolog [Topomyia yanbarensis]
MEYAKSAYNVLGSGYPFRGKYTVQFKYFKFDPRLKTTKWQSDSPPVVVNPLQRSTGNSDQLNREAKQDRKVSYDKAHFVESDLPLADESDRNSSTRHDSSHLSPCPVCGKMVKDAKSHMFIHSGEKQFPCSFCSKKFTHKSDRNVHENIHKGLKPYKCSECPSSFAHRKSLLTHKVTHTKSRNYRCHICGKTYGHLIVLKKHLTAHRNERRYQCSICNKAFLAKQVLQNHMLIHSNERPHQCTICTKRFRRADSLQAHSKVHQRNTAYACNVCNIQFECQRALDQHRNDEHMLTDTNDGSIFINIDQSTDSQQTDGAQRIAHFYDVPVQQEGSFAEQTSTNEHLPYAVQSYTDQLNELGSGESYSLSWEGDSYQF